MRTYRMMGLNSWAGAGYKVMDRMAQRSTISSPVLHIKTRKLKDDGDMYLTMCHMARRGQLVTSDLDDMD